MHCGVGRVGGVHCGVGGVGGVHCGVGGHGVKGREVSLDML